MDKIVELIEFGYECDYLDFKERQYHKDKSMDLLMDIMAMANSRHYGDKFIIIGVKERPEGKEIKGIDPKEFIDSSTYVQLVLNNIEPEIQFDYFKYEYKGAVLGVFKICKTENKPYMMRKKFDRLNEGYCLIRKGSTNTVAKRSDFDYMYLNKGQFEIRFLEQALHAVHDAEGCASIEIVLANTTELPITIIGGTLYIRNDYGKELSRHHVYGLDEFIGADFKLSLPPRSEVVGHLMVGFESSDSLRLSIDEYGICAEKYMFELLLVDARMKRYTATIREAEVFAKGDFLWKVKQQKGIPHKFRTHR
ncbi:ATP-binding protein [Paenibacillus thiaminolyticus]|uniref:AlbA family DNA-binding domain-containing protein n=1 Tax=Paenibacillus thiaminolyticus TaxID=49283 RepID=UPI00116464BF|nr:ATP-binding protein [Paenibacillus thiaminolyticus]NGP58567.1 ATP-binding protein [Paenibacillus thiaminolyticus]